MNVSYVCLFVSLIYTGKRLTYTTVRKILSEEMTNGEWLVATPSEC